MPKKLFRSLVPLTLVASACAAPDEAAGRILSLGSDTLVLAAVYAGGGNVGASYERDFVVVVNRGDSPVSTEGFSLQYASATGSAALGATEATRTPLPARRLEPGAALLVVADGGGLGGASLGSGDVPDATPLSLATSGGRLALVRGQDSLGCNGASSPCDASALARVVDLVGWGTAGWYEAHAAPAMSNTLALVRLDDGCIDTDDGRKDLALLAPTPRALADAPRPCVAVVADAGIVDAAVVDAAVVDAAAVDAAATGPDAGVDAGPLAQAELASSVQGVAHRSPRVGANIVGLEGVVTWVEGRRFALQSAPDLDERTSDAIFVTTEAAAPVGVGLRVRVDGTVREPRPSCAFCGSAEASLSVTTVAATGIAVLGSAALPAAVDIGHGRLPRSLGRFETPVDLDAVASLDPVTSRIDRLESLEGMRVVLDEPQVVGPTEARGDGARELVVTDTTTAALVPSGRIESIDDAMRLVLLEGGSLPLPFLDVGDRFAGAVEGIVDYERGRYVLRVVAHGGAKRQANAPVQLPALEPGASRIASFNLHGLSAADPAARFAEVAEAIVHELESPELVALQELGDDDGLADVGVVSAGMTASKLTDAIRVRGGPEYQAVWLDPLDGRDGGAPGLNIRPALLVRRGGRIELVRRARASADDASPIVRIDGEACLAASPMHLGAGAPAFDGGRKPLLAELRVDGRRVIAMVVHLRSALGDPPLEGRLQPPSRPSDATRLGEAEVIAAFADALRADGLPLLVLGDFNEPSDRAASARLLAAGLVESEVEPQARSSFVHEGLGAQLDHVRASNDLAPSLVDATVVQRFASRSLAASDHDPIVATLLPLEPASPRGAGCAIAHGSPPTRPLDRVFFGVLVLAALRRRIARDAPRLRRASRRCP